MNPSAKTDVARIPKRSKLSGIRLTLPDRASYALDQKLIR